MSNTPRDCYECPFTNHCMAGMYHEGCEFYPPQEEKIGFFKRLFSKFFK